MGIITFLSDFGTKSSYPAQMKAVALKISNAKLVDITHNITPHNLIEGAFVLKNSTPFFPSGTVHVAVVDPGVGTKRKGIVITTKTQILVGPDNGLLIPAARNLGDFKVYEISNTDLLLDNISNTFHGRDIFTPIAAHIINGVFFEKIGPVIDNYVDLDFKKPKKVMDNIVGEVIYIDDFGNIITNIKYEDIKNIAQQKTKIQASISAKKLVIPFLKSYGHARKGEPLSTIGSSNHLEISINQGNAAERYSVKAGDEIKIKFIL